MWAAVHLHEDQDQIQHVPRNMDVEQIQQIFAKRKTRLPSCNTKSYLECVESGAGKKAHAWKSCNLLHKDIEQCTAMVFFSQTPCYVFVGIVHNFLNQREFENKTEFSSELQHTGNWTTSVENRSCSNGKFSRAHYEAASPIDPQVDV